MEGTEGNAGKKAGLGLEPTGFTAHCPHCRRETLFIPARIRHSRHLLIIVLTAGLWTIVWAALVLGKCLRPWRCSVCGWHKPEFRKNSPLPAPSPREVQPPTVE
jgi:hypothetical protein